MMSQPRNKFIDRFRTQILKPSANLSEEKTDREMHANSSANIRSSHHKKSNSKSIDIQDLIVRNLEKHIAYLEKKLKEQEQENEKIKNLLDAAQKKMVENDIEQQNLINQIEELNESLQNIENKYDLVRSDYENLLLKQKMQKLSGQVNSKKEAFARLQLKHHQHKKGRFSGAFLPSSFGSPAKYNERSSKQYQPIIKQYQMKNSEEKAAISQQAFNNQVLHEYKLVKKENQGLLQSLNQLKHKNHVLQEQIRKNQIVKNQQSDQTLQIQNLRRQNQELRQKLDEKTKQNKLFLNKIAQNQERLVEISMAVNERSQSVASLSRNIALRIEKQMQTEQQFNPETRDNFDTQQLEERIQLLTKKLKEKDEMSREPAEPITELNHLTNSGKKWSSQGNRQQDCQSIKDQLKMQLEKAEIESAQHSQTLAREAEPSQHILERDNLE